MTEDCVEREFEAIRLALDEIIVAILMKNKINGNASELMMMATVKMVGATAATYAQECAARGEFPGEMDQNINYVLHKIKQSIQPESS
jgi:hypothetical protein